MTEDHDQFIASLLSSWAQDRPLSLEDIFQQNPSLRTDESAALDLIYAEVLIREQRGLPAIEADYQSRFPQYREQIARQFQIHRAL